jgi:cobalt-zinc-cadmium efflux system membrane fusion protein
MQLVLADLEFDTVRVLPPDTLRLTGSVTFDAARVSHVGPRMQGRIKRVPVEIGSRVRAGDTLAVLDSPELGSAQATWFTASVEREVARRNYERAERLFLDGIVSERRRLEAEGEFRKAEGRLAAAERALAALGAEPDSAASSLFVLRAPLDGVVADKHATVGEVVASDAQLFTVGDLRRLWIMLDIYESDLTHIVVGAPAFVSTEAYPGRLFAAEVAYVGATVDTTSRTVKVRVVIPNGDEALKPGMFAEARIVLPDHEERIGVPQAALQTLEGNTVVFIPAGPRRFRAAAVTTGRSRAGAWVEITAGLALGDRIVTSGSFTLKADLEKSSFADEGD